MVNKILRRTCVVLAMALVLEFIFVGTTYMPGVRPDIEAMNLWERIAMTNSLLAMIIGTIGGVVAFIIALTYTMRSIGKFW